MLINQAINYENPRKNYLIKVNIFLLNGKKFRNKKKNIDVFIGDQTDPIFLEKFFQKK